ncbi:hypothetical protein GHT09_005450 [Marmota monax]|uniref:Uncharacterized protein n=1 Tax=Marmota monax TaxID=9995 RepID=A0A834PRI6_MARMO|nr:hypothetical protein GHT09_005450 [Marmota monax]
MARFIAWLRLRLAGLTSILIQIKLLLKHAPVEWNFLLNKVLLTQLPVPGAQAELSSRGSRSMLMNPLKYRLIGIVALAPAGPATPGLLEAPRAVAPASSGSSL